MQCQSTREEERLCKLCGPGVGVSAVYGGEGCALLCSSPLTAPGSRWIGRFPLTELCQLIHWDHHHMAILACMLPAVLAESPAWAVAKNLARRARGQWGDHLGVSARRGCVLILLCMWYGGVDPNIKNIIDAFVACPGELWDCFQHISIDSSRLCTAATDLTNKHPTPVKAHFTQKLPVSGDLTRMCTA